MDLKILDGRGSFYQWDLNQKLQVENPTVEEVHFPTEEGNALVCLVYDGEDGRTVDVPNILLQTAGVLRAFAVAGERTLFCHNFRVNPREKPDDYIYTETEVWTVEQAVQEAVQEAIKNIPDGGGAAEGDTFLGYEEISPNIIDGYVYVKYKDRILYLEDTSVPNCACTEVIYAKSGDKFQISGKYGFNYLLITEFDENGAMVSYHEGGYSDGALAVATDYEYTVPDGVNGFAVSTIDNKTNPIVAKKAQYGSAGGNTTVDLAKQNQRICKNRDDVAAKADKGFVYDCNSIMGLIIDLLKKATFDEDVKSKIEALENSVYPNALKLTSGLPTGTYTLKYEDANGVMADYLDICTFKVDSTAQTIAYTGFIPENVSPKTAEKIGVYNESGARVGEIALGLYGANRYYKFLTPRYTFAAISDAHLGLGDGVEDLTNAVAYFDSNDDIAFAVICGDCVNDGTNVEQLETYQSIVADMQKPMYVSIGNHEMINMDIAGADKDISGNYATISQYFAQNAYPNINQELYYSFEKNGDVFIMLGVYGNSNYDRALSDEELQWLYETLEANRNKRCFLFHHHFPWGGSGDAVKCYGDNGLKGYKGEVFYNLLRHYKNVIYFHGHSHAEFRVQELNRYNTIDKEYGMYSIHIPSIMWSTYPNAVQDAYVKDATTGEGYIVDVYSTGVHLKGRDFEQGKYTPIASYWLPTTLQEVEAGTFYDETGTINIE